MAAWASLSGYLYFKPGGGALSRLMAKKKMWCVLDESRGQLLYHRSEEEARCKPPSGSVELRGAAISLDLDNQNQFVIIVDSKEIFLTAENHESMMIWLMALQAKRDHFAKYENSGAANNNPTLVSADNASRPARGPTLANLGEDEVRERSSSDVSVMREGGHRLLTATKSLQPNFNPLSFGVNCNLSASDNSSAQLRRLQMTKLGETFDGGHPSGRETPVGGSLPFSRKLSISMEGTERLHRKSYAVQSPAMYSTSHGTDLNFLTPPSRALHACPTVGETSSEGTADSDELQMDELPNPGACHNTASRGSSLSASSDSAIDKGDNSDMTARIQELEKELISSKCELAKVLNRQTCFQDIMKQKDEIIMDLDDKLSKLEGGDTVYDSKRRTNQASKELQERIRILQNQNRFLNEEVRRLARIGTQEQSKIKDQDNRVRALEARIEEWKLQYVSLIQSSIRFTGTDTMDDAELSLYGGDRHSNKVRSLLDDARKVNPSLPTFENLSAGEVHVDVYGFKHQFSDCGLLLHYLCQELTQHFLLQAGPFERHQQAWLQYIRNNARGLLRNRKDLKQLCRRGIPDQHRRQMWRAFIQDSVSDLVVEKGPHYYRSLCSMLPDSPLAARYRKQISLDLMRTMPCNIRFSTSGSKGIMDMQDVLLAFCIHNPNVGYCQGMNFLVAMALLFMDAHDAFWTLVAVTERYHTASYFDHNLLGAQADQSVLRDLLVDLLPDLARHLAAIDIEISTVTLNWFLAIFFDAVPFQTLLRIWDCFLLEGPKVLFRFTLAILKMHEKEIVQKSETISVMRHLKACARVTYDVDGLVQLAFKGFKPFPRRQDITSRQTVYLKALKEKYRWRELQKLAFAERENLFLSLETETGTDSLTFECSTITATGEVWACYGNQTQCKVCVVDCREGTMTDLEMQFPCRVMALCAAPGAIVFGTLSWNVICYKTSDRSQAWEQQLHDAVLSLCQYQDGSATRVFAGLADGTVAVFEDVSTTTTFYDVMYIMIGQSPVTCLRLVESQLWCACGNTVSVIHASTLDAMDGFSVSSNPYDHILALQPGLPGVWISVRGSSILELWDPATLCCKMLYDTRAGRYPNLRKDDEVYFNRARITCILPLDYSVWVGTGEGSLITYDVFTHQGSKTPSDSSSFVGSYSEGFSAFAAKEDKGILGLSDDFDPVREAAMRVRALYLCQPDDECNKNYATTSPLINPRESVTCDKTLNSVTSACNGRKNGRNESAEVSEGDSSQAGATSKEQNVSVTSPDEGGQTGLSTDTSNTDSLTPGRDMLSPDCLSPDCLSPDCLSPDCLSPDCLSPGEDSGGITPTTSFCVSENSAFSVLDKCQGEHAQSETRGTDNHADVAIATRETDNNADAATATCAEESCTVVIGKDINANVNKAVTCTSEKEQEHARNSENQQSSVEISSLNKPPSSESTPIVDGQPEKDSETCTLKSTSLKNGVRHGFYLGEPTENTFLNILVNGSTSMEEDTVNGSTSAEEDNNRNELRIEDSSDKAWHSGSDTRQKEKESTEQLDSSIMDSVEQRSDGSAKQKRKQYHRQKSESSIPEEDEDKEDEVASSDNSVIMQVGDAITTKSRKGTRESFKSCRESESESKESHSRSLSSTLSQESQHSGDVSATDCPQTNLKINSMGSSITSQNSGSDEVFQDANGFGSQSAEGQSSATETPVEECLPETGQADTLSNTGSSQSLRDNDDMLSNTGSSQSLRDMDNNSCTSSDEGHKHLSRKRPQSLFANRHTHRSHKTSAGNVDKLEKSQRRLTNPPLLPLPSLVSSAKRNSVSSLTTSASIDIVDNFQSADPEVQYRLDYTNCHVDTDVDDASVTSRRGSSVLDDSAYDLESRLKVAGWKDYDGSSDSGDAGLRLLDCDPSSFIFPQDVYNLQDPNAAVGRAMMDGSVGIVGLSQLVKTPALSMLSCRTWSSYDEVSTPSVSSFAVPTTRGSRHPPSHLPHNNSQLSMATSVASTMDLLYAADMTLMSKNKISDKPVKCLLLYMFEERPLVLSFSGCHDDDEAVLRWTREKEEMLWTNQPVLDYNPATKVTTLPSYMKARLSSSSSSKSLTQRLSNSSQ